ncbi:MAG: hypothetical protein IPI03_01650 [Rubrivivax sp.]|nr:hypothetical protein [Rubrivivax sp.]
MSIASDLLHSLQQAWAGRPKPRVRALHLPPVPWNGSKDGEFGAIELDSGALGLSYLLFDDALARVSAASRAGAGLVGADALDLAAEWAGGEASPARATLGFAAVNALSRELFDRAGFVPPAAGDSVAGIDAAAGESIGMVGYFPPLLKPLLARGAQLTVLELRADLAGQHEGYRVTLDPQDLAGCSQVLCTSTALLNHTLDSVLAHCAKARRVVLIGPGAGCLPDALFAHGISALAGSWISDPAAFKQALATGAPWSHAARKFLLQRDGYPGLAELR